MLSGSLTWQEKRELVVVYIGLAHGLKGPFLLEQGVTRHELRVWRAQMHAGSLEDGLVPRRGLVSRVMENREITRLAKINEELRKCLVDQELRHEAELAVKDRDLALEKSAVNALGKAIALLHPDNDSAAGPAGS